MDLSAWLRNLGLERYEPAFHDNKITHERQRVTIEHQVMPAIDA